MRNFLKGCCTVIGMLAFLFLSGIAGGLEADTLDIESALLLTAFDVMVLISCRCAYLGLDFEE